MNKRAYLYYMNLFHNIYGTEYSYEEDFSEYNNEQEKKDSWDHEVDRSDSDVDDIIKLKKYNKDVFSYATYEPEDITPETKKTKKTTKNITEIFQEADSIMVPPNNQVEEVKDNINRLEELNPCKDFTNLQQEIKHIYHGDYYERKNENLIKRFQEICDEMAKEIHGFFSQYEQLKILIYKGRMCENIQPDPMEEQPHMKSNFFDKIKKTIKEIPIVKDVRQKLHLETVIVKQEQLISVKYDLSELMPEVLKVIGETINLEQINKKIQDLFLTSLLLYEKITYEQREYKRFTWELKDYVYNKGSDEHFMEMTEMFNNFMQKYNKYNIYFNDNENLLNLYLFAHEEYKKLKLELEALKPKNNSLEERIKNQFILETKLYLKPEENSHNIPRHISSMRTVCYLESGKESFLKEPGIFLPMFLFNNQESFIRNISHNVEEYFNMVGSNEISRNNIKNIKEIVCKLVLSTTKEKKIETFLKELFTEITKVVKEPINIQNMEKYNWYLRNSVKILSEYYSNIYHIYRHNEQGFSHLIFPRHIIKNITEQAFFFQNYQKKLQMIITDMPTMEGRSALEVFLMLEYAQNQDGYVPLFLIDICLQTHNNGALSTYYNNIKYYILTNSQLNIKQYQEKLLHRCITYEDIFSVIEPLYLYSNSMTIFYNDLPFFLKTVLELLLQEKNQKREFFWTKKIKIFEQNKLFLEKKLQKLMEDYNKDRAVTTTKKKKNEPFNIKAIFNDAILVHTRYNSKNLYYYNYYILSVILDKVSLASSKLVLCVFFDCFNIIKDNPKDGHSYYDTNKVIESIIDKTNYYNENPLNVLKLFSKILTAYYEEDVLEYEVLLYCYNLSIIASTDSNILPIIPQYIQEMANKYKLPYEEVKDMTGLTWDPYHLDIICGIRRCCDVKRIFYDYPNIMYDQENLVINEHQYIKNKILIGRINLSLMMIEDYTILLHKLFNEDSSRHVEFLKTFLKNATTVLQYERMEKILELVDKPNLLLISVIMAKLQDYLSTKQDEYGVINPFFDDIVILLRATLYNRKIKINKQDLSFYFNKKEYLKKMKISEKNIENRPIEYTYISLRDYLVELMNCLQKYQDYETGERIKREQAALREQQRLKKEEANSLKEEEKLGEKNRSDDLELKSIIVSYEHRDNNAYLKNQEGENMSSIHLEEGKIEEISEYNDVGNNSMENEHLNHKHSSDYEQTKKIKFDVQKAPQYNPDKYK